VDCLMYCLLFVVPVPLPFTVQLRRDGHVVHTCQPDIGWSNEQIREAITHWATSDDTITPDVVERLIREVVKNRDEILEFFGMK